jgi:putative ABC transport system permease protein
MIIVRLALKSLRNRALTAILTSLAIALSVTLLLGVEKIRTGARQSFADTISGTDLIVGARSGNVQLLLYSIFRIGNATNDINWKTYQEIDRQPEVAWTVPISLGDSHRGFRVLGTTTGYFQHYAYRGKSRLSFAQGSQFSDLFDAVIGADVAAKLGYKLGDEITLAHGIGEISFVEHTGKPFKIVGILAKTGTPVDRTVHVSLQAIEAIHVGEGQPDGQTIEVTPDELRKMNIVPKDCTAILVGLKSRASTLALQRAINDYAPEPLTAIIPGAALQELWGLVGSAETALSAISAMVVATALLGMVTMILTALHERRREMAILRSVGASPFTVLGLLTVEAVFLTVAGAVLGVLLLYAGLGVLQPYVDRTYGLFIRVGAPTAFEWLELAAVVVAGLLAGLLPAIRAYRLSLADGMTVRT